MTMFFIGLTIGLSAGAVFGMLAMAVFYCAGKDGKE
jgi:hypothetical protein